MPKNKTDFEDFDVTTQRFVLAVAKVMGVDGKKMFNTFTRELDEAKRICYLAYRKKGLSYPNIAKRLHRDHTTVMAGVRRIIDNRHCHSLADQILKQESLFLPIAGLTNAIKEKLNKAETIENIADDLSIGIGFVKETKELLDSTCEKKKVPNYKNCTIREIYC